MRPAKLSICDNWEKVLRILLPYLREIVMVGEEEGLEEDGSEVFEAGGKIKWFNALKGYGFITPDNESGDIFLHLSCLRQAGYEYLEEGVTVTCLVARRDKGLQAVRLISVDVSTADQAQSPRAPAAGGVGPRNQPEDVEEGYREATVKWFNRIRGYGFLTEGEGTPDIFVHIETLRREGITNLEPGQAVRVRIGRGGKGLQAAEVQII